MRSTRPPAGRGFTASAWALAACVAGCVPAPKPPPPTDGDGARIEHLAAASFVITLLDDDVPPRWRDAGSALRCESPSTVTVNGHPLRAGDEVPATSFALQWQLLGCEVVGGHRARYSGTVHLQVVHEEDGALGAIVDAAALRAVSAEAPPWPRHAFVARSPRVSEPEPWF